MSIIIMLPVDLDDEIWCMTGFDLQVAVLISEYYKNIQMYLNM